ncbi:MAG: hypothetical protein H0V17_20955, partial [Deltaproteobacteria bacterium]|nr:hypothetical protein [Deltaproteobacteria bacterium]
MRGAIRTAVVTVAIAISVGCAGEIEHPISEWTLAYEGTNQRVVLPEHLDVPDHAMTFTLRADFAVPPELRDRPLSLVIPFFAAVTRLRVDGLDATDTEPELVRGYRARGPKSWQFPSATRGRAQLALEITVDHRWKQSGWLDTIPRVVPSQQHDSMLTAIKLINDYGAVLALFGLTLIGVLYLGIYLVDRRRKQYKWFAIQGLSAISYPLFLSGLSQGLFGRFDVVLLAGFLP